MSSASFRIHASLGNFLAPAHRLPCFDHSYARAATLKQAIESLVVPHTESAVSS